MSSSPHTALPLSQPLRTQLVGYLALRQIHWDPAYLGFLVFFIINTTYIINVGTIAMVVAIFGLALGSHRVQWPTPIFLLLTFWMWSVLSTILSQYPGDLREVEEFGKTILVFLVSFNVLRQRPALHFFLLVYVTIFILFPARGTIFNYYIYDNTRFGRPGWVGSFGNPNDASALMLLAIAVAASFIHERAPRLVRYVALLAVCLFPSVILLTQSRAAFIGLIAFALFVVLTLRGRRIRTFVMMVAIGAIISIFVPDGVWKRIAGLKYATSAVTVEMMDTEGSAGQRWEIWQTGVHIISDNLVFGIGLGRYEQANLHYNPALGPRNIHSTYLEVLAETGIPGFLLYLWLLIALIFRLRRARRNAYALRDIEDWRRLQLLEFGLYSYLIAGIWGTFAFLTHFYIYFAILYAQAEVLELLARGDKKDNMTRCEKKRRKR